MKAFFQGLVIGAAVMYWYLNLSAQFLTQVQQWFGTIGGQYRNDHRHEEAEKALHGFLLWKDRQLPVREKRVVG